MLAHRAAQGKTRAHRGPSDGALAPSRVAPYGRSMAGDPDYAPGAYGDRIATDYDDLHTHMDPTDAVEALARLAGGGRALELGIGTGRIALPLAARGVEVHGLDASEAMVAKLRAKPGGEAIPVMIGDFADVGVEGEFDLIFVAFNTFFALLTQEEQLRCVRNVAAHLSPGGVFVVEAFVPDMCRYDHTGQALRMHRVEGERVMFDASTLDRAQQRITTRLVSIDGEAVTQYPIEIRYVWPSELDLMARLAGLRLRERWSDWQGGLFDAASRSHVSIYERA